MRINWLSYQQREYDGYGRWCNRMIQALDRAGCDVAPWLSETANMPKWMWERLGVDWSRLTISCLPPAYLHPVPGRHWLYSMTEGSVLPTKPDDWADIINRSGVERVIVPCEHNRRAFVESGVKAPVYVIPGGTDPDEFPVMEVVKWGRVPYTFLALGDRGARKGWTEVWQAFYKAFGTPQDTPDVRLIIKSRPKVNDLLDMISKAENPDPRITIMQEDLADMRTFYAMGDCFVIPSRSEGWGMPHREAAMMGLPVITQQYSGMDDGQTVAWSIPLRGGKLEPIPSNFEHIKGEWLRADVCELANTMRWCYENPQSAEATGINATDWLRRYQTWDHTAKRLLTMIREAS